VTRRTVLKVVGVGAAAAVLGQLASWAYLPSLREAEHALSADEAAMVEAIGARIWPGSPSDPGAREAGTVHYVDRALAGAYAVWLPTYRAGLRQLDAAAKKKHGKSFVALAPRKQDAMLTALSEGRLAGVQDGARFFVVVRVHTLEGLFADPMYGGNRGLVGWRAVGYPGPFYSITAEQQQSFAAHTLPYRSLADL